MEGNPKSVVEKVLGKVVGSEKNKYCPVCNVSHKGIYCSHCGRKLLVRMLS